VTDDQIRRYGVVRGVSFPVERREDGRGAVPSKKFLGLVSLETVHSSGAFSC